MKTFSKYFFILLASSIVFTSVHAREKGRHVIIPKLGSYEIDTANQSSNRNFTTESDWVYGVEYEWHLGKGFSIGGEHMQFENDFTNTGVTYTSTTDAVLFNAKYHFPLTDAFKPFIGIGAGAAVIDTDEFLFDTYSGRAYQFTAGMTYRFEHVGIYFEYKRLRAKLKEDIDTGNADKIDVSGKGAMLGISILL